MVSQNCDLLFRNLDLKSHKSDLSVNVLTLKIRNLTFGFVSDNSDLLLYYSDLKCNI